jgi:hypothetical protein
VEEMKKYVVQLIQDKKNSFSANHYTHILHNTFKVAKTDQLNAEQLAEMKKMVDQLAGV